jgi:putative ABC transport system permease protein
MTTLRRLWFFLTRWRRVQELDEEMRLHVEMRAAANRRNGAPPDEAWRAARRRFGNPLKLREESRDAWGFPAFEQIGRDLHFSVRQIIRRPLSSIVVVMTLALGVGANTAVFSLIDTLLFKPAAWDRGEQLVWVASFRGRGDRVGAMSYPHYISVRDQPTTTTALLAYGGHAVAIGGTRPQRVLAGLVSDNYFDVLGLPAARGRMFTRREDAAPGADRVVVLSDALWKEHFGGRPDIIGRSATINGVPFTIIGVAPPGFTGVTYATNAERLWILLTTQPVAMPTDPGRLHAAEVEWLKVAARLRPGATVGQAESELQVIVDQLNPPQTPPDRQAAAQLIPVRGGLTPWEQGELAPVFGLVAIVPGLVLLVACANVANVLLARHLSRRREFAMRRAVGASRARLIRLLFTESLVVALLSAAAGYVIAFGFIDLIAHFGDVPREETALLQPDQRMLVATMVLGIAITFVFGLVPAITATQFDVLPVLKDDALTAAGSGRRVRLRGVLVVAQVAVSLSLIITAALLLQSLAKAMRIDPGFDPRGAVAVSFDPSLHGYTPTRRDDIVVQLVERAAAIPGVESAAITSSLPLGGQFYGASILAEDARPPVQALVTSVSPNYFATLRLPLVSGRDFGLADRGNAAAVVIVNERLASRLWPDKNPIGSRLRIDEASAEWEVVGVVRDSKYSSLTEAPRSALYLPVAQRRDSPLSLVVRTAGTPTAVLSSLEQAAHSVDPDLALFGGETLEQSQYRANNLRRASGSLFGVLGFLTLALASIGVYGVVAHTVSRRTREIGIRMSLGARPADVMRMLAGESIRLSLTGVTIGVGISFLASRVLTAFLFGLTATDAMTFVVASVGLCTMCGVATYVPARHGARIPPMAALRHD